MAAPLGNDQVAHALDQTLHGEGLDQEIDVLRAQLTRVAELVASLQTEVPGRVFTAAAAGDVRLGRSAARRPTLALPPR